MFFQSFYWNLAGNLMAKLPKSPNRYAIQFISGYCKKLSLFENFTLDSTTEGYLFNIMKNLPVTKSARIDQISEKWSTNFAKPISELWNLSMTLEGFPDACEIAKVKALFKKSSKTNPSNYRPKSLPPLLSKVFE